MALLLRNARVLTDRGSESDTNLRIEGGTVAEVGRALSANGSEEVDLRGQIVAPGFIDLHIHGAAGVLCEDGDGAAIRRLAAGLPRYGVTGFLPTLAALPRERLRAAVATIASVRGTESGARILGIHLEGPFLNPKVAGAQRADWMRAPACDELAELQEIAAGGIRLLTIAPELPGAHELIAAARRLAITVALGHTEATAEQTRAAIAAGATHVTHLFNAMRPLHHREPGAVGVALTDDGVSVELIADGHHVAPAAIDLAWRCKPHDKLVLVSDAVALGVAEGRRHFFGTDCIVAGGAIRLASNGALAGSCLSLDRALQNLRAWLPQAPLDALLASVSLNPAAVIGESCGLTPGRRADLVVLDPRLAVARTMVAGRWT